MDRRYYCLISAVVACLVSDTGLSEVKLRGFGDAGGIVGKHDFTFYNGSIDLFLTKNLDTNTNALAEVVFEMGGDNVAVLDPERLWIQHRFSDWFKVKLGRVHTALGYWNDAFHHGTYLQVTTFRPSMYAFEDDGGFLPVHSSGIEFRGEGRVGPGRLGYIANYANGRGPEPDPPQIVNDADRHKAKNILLYYKFGFGLRLGGVYYLDTMPGSCRENPADASVAESSECSGTVFKKGDERIAGGHVIINAGQFELISEYLEVKHKYSTGEPAATVKGFYLQMSCEVQEIFEIFARNDQVDADPDAYTGLDKNLLVNTIGVRMDLWQNNAIKIEYSGIKKSDVEYKPIFGINWSFAW